MFKTFEQIGKEVFTVDDAMRVGISRNTLSRAVRTGTLVRLRQGVYSFPGCVEDDMLTVALSSDKIVFSHETALFLNGISDRTPFVHSITIPSSGCLPGAIRGKCKCHYAQAQHYALGAIRIKNTFGNTVCCYNAERTICDIIRGRSRIDDETFFAAIRNYAASKHKDLALLGRYAATFKVQEQVRDFIGVLT